MRQLDGRVALVTGAGRGIGASVARLLAASGAAVGVNDLPSARPEAVADEICASGGRAAALPGSVVTDAEEIVAAASGLLGGLDILVNNAGVTRDAMIHRMTDEDWGFVLDVVLKGAFNMIRASAPWMRQSRSDPRPPSCPCKKIVNIASVNGIYGLAGNANYSAAKAGLIGLTKSVAREWARHRVCVNAVAPGYVAGTRLTAPRDPETRLGMPEEVIARVEAQIPIGRPGRTEDVAEACLWLSSPASDYCTGQVIEMHGGREIVEVL